MPRLKIYGIARTRAFRVLWMAQELGLDYEHIPIETGAEGARKPEYLAVNPNGRLPAIDDDGFIMWESLAINLYLAKKHSDRGPLSGHAAGRSKGLAMEPVGGERGRARSERLVIPCTASAPFRAQSTDRRGCDCSCWRRPLPYSTGSWATALFCWATRFTVADLNVAAVIGRAIEMDLAATSHLARWLRRCLDRPAAQAVQRLRGEAEATASIESTRAAARRNRL